MMKLLLTIKNLQNPSRVQNRLDQPTKTIQVEAYSPDALKNALKATPSLYHNIIKNKKHPDPLNNVSNVNLRDTQCTHARMEPGAVVSTDIKRMVKLPAHLTLNLSYNQITCQQPRIDQAKLEETVKTIIQEEVKNSLEHPLNSFKTKHKTQLNRLKNSRTI